MQTTFSLFKDDNPREIVLLPCSDGFCILSVYSWNTAQPVHCSGFHLYCTSVDSLEYHNIRVSFVYQWPCVSGLVNQNSMMQYPSCLPCKHRKDFFSLVSFKVQSFFSSAYQLLLIMRDMMIFIEMMKMMIADQQSDSQWTQLEARVLRNSEGFACLQM